MKVLVPIGFAVFVGPAVLAAQNVAPPTPASVVAAATADEWVEIAAGDLLVMELSLTAEGKPRQVVIQLLPSPFSQAWVANITALARAHWWDGTSVYRVVDNWVAQWGDGEEKTAEAKPLPTGIAAPHAPYTVILAALPRPRGAPPPVCTDPDGHCERPHNSGAALARDPYALGTQFRLGWPIAADPSADAAWPVHCYGSVGVARDLAPDTGTGAELYAVIGHAPRQFDRNIAVVGRVIEGIEHLAILPRGGRGRRLCQRGRAYADPFGSAGQRTARRRTTTLRISRQRERELRPLRQCARQSAGRILPRAGWRGGRVQRPGSDPPTRGSATLKRQGAGQVRRFSLQSGQNQGRAAPMIRNRQYPRVLSAVSALAMGVAAVTLPSLAAAQERPADLATLPPVPTDFTPEKLPWGDYDFTGTWPIENLNAGRILFQRPTQYGNRFWVTDEEFARRLEAARRNDGNFAQASDQGVGAPGTQGLEEWFKTANFDKRTSMLVSPADGQLPPLTPKGERLYREGRSGWVPGQHYDWVSDFDSWDRCVSRGFPASMYPFRYNNGIRVFQAPGTITITIVLEMLGTRVAKIYDSKEAAQTAGWGEPVEAWMGNPRAWWDGKSLVIETTNIVSGDSATREVTERSASPLNMATQHVPPFNTIPMSTEAMTVERLTMTDANTIVHELTYTDPQVYTAPWTTRIEWTRDDDYQFFEYACHEGNYMPRDYISASRAQRRDIAAGLAAEVTAETDDRSRFAEQFDWDPGVGPRPASRGAGG